MNSPIHDYFFDKTAFDSRDGAYIHLQQPNTPEAPLNVPEMLTPDKVDGDDIYYTLTAQTGSTQLLTGAVTQTWGYNGSLLGPTVLFETGKTYHITLKNALDEVTTFHWHGLNIVGPYDDGGPHAPVYPGGERKITFTVDQPSATLWLHPHPCPETARQVWNGLAAMVLIKDDHERSLNLPADWGKNDIPVIMQDRTYYDNQLDYQKSYDVDGTLGEYPLINGTLNPYFEVTSPIVRLRFLDGSNRREWRLHFSDNHPFTQISSDGGLLPQPVEFDHLMLTTAERADVLVNFSDYQEGDVVTLQTDDLSFLTFKIGKFDPEDLNLPETLATIPDLTPDDPEPTFHTVMSGMDDEVRLDGKLFDMQRIDTRQELNKVALWEVTNTNDMDDGMIHPFHVHGCQFQVLKRDGHDVYANEHGWKDTIGVNPGETVLIKIQFTKPGVFMYHCHILEHEDTGMMAQIEIYDPKHPVKYHLLSMDEMMHDPTKK